MGLWGVPKCPVVFGSVRCSRPRTVALGLSDGVRQRFPATSRPVPVTMGPNSLTLGKGIVMRKIVLAAVLALMAGGAQAATLNVVGGQLMGASGVLVDGNLYDVQFLGGSCIDAYSGCDEASDFTFQAFASAELASQALLDQVFLDGVDGLFDSEPALTNGCSFPNSCGSSTPYATLHPVILFSVVAYQSINAGDLVYDATYYNFLDHAPELTWAVWTATVVPEPSTALLLGLGLTGLAAKGRRRS